MVLTSPRCFSSDGYVKWYPVNLWPGIGKAGWSIQSCDYSSVFSPSGCSDCLTHVPVFQDAETVNRVASIQRDTDGQVELCFFLGSRIGLFLSAQGLAHPNGRGNARNHKQTDGHDVVARKG